MDEGYRRLIHLALAHRPTVIAFECGIGRGCRAHHATIPTEFRRKTDERPR